MYESTQGNIHFLVVSKRFRDLESYLLFSKIFQGAVLTDAAIPCRTENPSWMTI